MLRLEMITSLLRTRINSKIASVRRAVIAIASCLEIPGSRNLTFVRDNDHQRRFLLSMAAERCLSGP
ncbi:hypothetical protein L596_020018 [Steinernema carpocapsae]|uniref:Uncharacterized protein n=1 Tax=Steinernema carpocapsae TaxID=34508 RepID=A0A4U5MSA0_STECR|nr:hypothetical protein L596_020018 [Steinernema carpocapsae]